MRTRLALRLLPALAIALLAVTPVAAATCSQGNLTGTWRAYGVGIDGATPYWFRCTLTIQGGGALKAGTTCVYDDGETQTVEGGQIRVNSACVVTGTVDLPGGTAFIRHGSIDAGLTAVTGVGDNGPSSTLFMFNALRRP
jgi:hypothetical protein